MAALTTVAIATPTIASAEGFGVYIGGDRDYYGDRYYGPRGEFYGHDRGWHRGWYHRDYDRGVIISEFAYWRRISPQEVGCGRALAVIEANLRPFHAGSVSGRVLRIKSDDDETEIQSWSQPAMGEGVGDDRDHGPAQRRAGIVRQQQDTGLGPNQTRNCFVASSSPCSGKFRGKSALGYGATLRSARSR